MEIASITYDKDTLGESNASRDLRTEVWRVGLLNLSETFGLIFTLYRVKVGFVLPKCLGRTPIAFSCDECCPQILSRLSAAQRFLKMKLQTLSISSATATAFIVLSFLMTASALPVPQLTLAPRAHDGSFQSTNWSGYAVTGASGSVSDAKGSWTVPAIQGTCPSTNQYSSFWVGIDGFSSGTVEQTGTDSDCQNGVPTYYAWFEFFPHPLFLINGLTITPGDHMTAEANFNGRFTVTITDTTTGVSFSTSAKVHSAQRSSAEWIAEAPSSSGGVLPLADFGTVSFSADTATVSGVTGAIGSFGSSVQVITMVSSSGAVKAQPSSLFGTNGDSFSVTWKSAGP